MWGIPEEFEPGPETFMCPRAALMWRARGVMVNLSGLCHDAPSHVDGVEVDLVAALSAEAARTGKIAEKAGQVVRNCGGCDSNGIRHEGVTQCPQETADKAREWWREALRMRT